MKAAVSPGASFPLGLRISAEAAFGIDTLEAERFRDWCATEGFDMPKGYVYMPVESPRGELGVYLESDGGPKPYRVHWRTPSFVHLQALPLLAKGHLVADLVALIGTIDVVLGDVDR